MEKLAKFGKSPRCPSATTLLLQGCTSTQLALSAPPILKPTYLPFPFKQDTLLTGYMGFTDRINSKIYLNPKNRTKFTV